MVKVYVSLCEKGARNFNTVPKKLQADVRAQIEADGFVINADGTVSPAVEEEE